MVDDWDDAMTIGNKIRHFTPKDELFYQVMGMYLTLLLLFREEYIFAIEIAINESEIIFQKTNQ